MSDCIHTFKHIRTDSYKKESGYRRWKFVEINYYFCELCLEEKEVRKEFTGDYDDAPEWAKLITKIVY